MKEKIEKLKTEFQELLEKTESLQDLESLKNQFLAKKGIIVSLYQELKSIADNEKAAFGKAVNELREVLEKSLLARQQQLTYKNLSEQVEKEWLDVSLDLKKNSGALHPISKIQYELEDFFTAMGFSILDGPHIETNYYNFEALNIPKNHPSRDLQDTYYFDENFYYVPKQAVWTYLIQNPVLQKENSPVLTLLLLGYKKFQQALFP